MLHMAVYIFPHKGLSVHKAAGDTAGGAYGGGCYIHVFKGGGRNACRQPDSPHHGHNVCGGDAAWQGAWRG